MAGVTLSQEDRLETMNLAWEMIKDYASQEGNAEAKLERKTKLFDQAYKAIIKTVFGKE